MVDLRWAPVTGVVETKQRTWKPHDPKPEAWLHVSSEGAGVDFRRESGAEDERTIEAMKDKKGLKVTTLTPEAEREWRAEVARYYPRVRGTIIPAPIFDTAVDTLKARHAAEQ